MSLLACHGGKYLLNTKMEVPVHVSISDMPCSKSLNCKVMFLSVCFACAQLVIVRRQPSIHHCIQTPPKENIDDNR